MILTMYIFLMSLELTFWFWFWSICKRWNLYFVFLSYLKVWIPLTDVRAGPKLGQIDPQMGQIWDFLRLEISIFWPARLVLFGDNLIKLVANSDIPVARANNRDARSDLIMTRIAINRTNYLVPLEAQFVCSITEEKLCGTENLTYV